jgi:hypothetical protein
MRFNAALRVRPSLNPQSALNAKKIYDAPTFMRPGTRRCASSQPESTQSAQRKKIRRSNIHVRLAAALRVFQPA